MLGPRGDREMYLHCAAHSSIPEAWGVQNFLLHTLIPDAILRLGLFSQSRSLS